MWKKERKGVPYPRFTNITEEMSRFFKPKEPFWTILWKSISLSSPLQFYWDLIDMGASLVAKWDFACGAGDVGLIPRSEDPLEEGIAVHSRILAWRIPWTEEVGGLWSIGLWSWIWLKWLSIHTHTLYKFKVYSIIVWLMYIMKFQFFLCVSVCVYVCVCVCIFCTR